VGNEMGNLYALRDLDGDGRVFGDNEAAGSLQHGATVSARGTGDFMG